MHAVSFGTYLYVTTTANPYVIDMTKGCQEQCTPVDDVNISLPDIACGYAHSAATPFGCVYVSKDGLALIKPDAQVDLLTKAYFSTEDWAKIRPETIRLTYWRGYIRVRLPDKASFMLEVDPSLYGDDTGAKAGNLTTFSDSPVDLIDSANDELLMMDSKVLYGSGTPGTHGAATTGRAVRSTSTASHRRTQ